ncbi:MAG: hypothetical protein HY456_02800 [Parcubacteria group bacterium]|nr:hypothetical protein [Parcubacteria group bacterium]
MKELGENIPGAYEKDGFKVGMKIHPLMPMTVRGAEGRDRSVLPSMEGEIKRIGGSIQDMMVSFLFPDGYKADLWVDFDEVEKA